jgi:rhodanese-related sulfurtransferase
MFLNALKSLFFRSRSGFSIKKVNSSPPKITDRTTLDELLIHYPAFSHFMMERFGIDLRFENALLPLHRFITLWDLPPAQILFMEFQLTQRTQVRAIPPAALKEKMQSNPGLVLLDAREPWELEHGKLPGAKPLNQELLNELMTHLPRTTPVAVYCHYGIRSMDAAIFLADQGFEKVVALSGGLEAWSEQVDPTFPRYAGHPC